VDSRRLRTLTTAPADLTHLCQPIDRTVSEFVDRRAQQRDLNGIAMGPNVGPYSWEGSWQYRRDCVQELRANFDYVLIDCPAIKEAGDVLSLAPFVDGVIIVVEADKTRKDQILHAEKSIEFARGNLIGHILNKRTYLVPKWLYEKL
jgi:Mrp family chromosome partitioning ATPase